MNFSNSDPCSSESKFIRLENIKFLQKKKLVELIFDNQESYSLPCEYLRLFSPSAEARVEWGVNGKVVARKEQVNLINIEPVGNYAVKLVFDDGHNTGIYTWEILYQLAIFYEENWQKYLSEL